MIERFGQGQRYHDVVKCGELLFLSGLTGTDAGDTIEAQAKCTLEKINTMLENYGSDKDHILRAEVFVKNQEDVAAFNTIWDEWINKNTSPARYLTVSKLGREPILVEIVITATIR